MSKSKSKAITKKFNTHLTLHYIFKNPIVFQKLVEQSDLAEEGGKQMGFSQHRYELLVNQFLAKEGADDVQRYRGVYSLENLKQANILVDWDRGKKQLTFSEHFIELIRLSDERLIRELTSVEYKGMLEEFKRLRDKLRGAGLEAFDEEYAEIRFGIFSHLRKIRTAIRNNEVKFRTISKKLADISSGITVDDVTYANAKRAMYAEASKLYGRHIKPTVEFLDSSLKIEGGNLFDVINDIIAIFNQRQEYSHAEELRFIAINLGNAYKPIDAIAGEVSAFLNVSRNNARAYNAFEKIETAIDQALDKVQSAKLNEKNLSKDPELAQVFDFFRGVEGVGNVRAKGRLVFADTQSFFDSMSIEIKQRIEAKGIVEELQLHEHEVEENGKKIDKKVSSIVRAKKLGALVESMSLRDTDDLYHMLHERLEGVLPDYSFFDLNVAMRGIRGVSDDYQVIPTGWTKTLEIDNHNYQYQVRWLRQKENN